MVSSSAPDCLMPFWKAYFCKLTQCNPFGCFSWKFKSQKILYIHISPSESKRHIKNQVRFVAAQRFGVIVTPLSRAAINLSWFSIYAFASANPCWSNIWKQKRQVFHWYKSFRLRFTNEYLSFSSQFNTNFWGGCYALRTGIYRNIPLSTPFFSFLLFFNFIILCQ